VTTETVFDIETADIGTRLPNRARIVAVRPAQYPDRWIVLALSNDSCEPYVTWEARRTGETYHGHYHEYLKTAIEDFEERIQ